MDCAGRQDRHKQTVWTDVPASALGGGIVCIDFVTKVNLRTLERDGVTVMRIMPPAFRNFVAAHFKRHDGVPEEMDGGHGGWAARLYASRIFATLNNCPPEDLVMCRADAPDAAYRAYYVVAGTPLFTFRKHGVEFGPGGGSDTENEGASESSYRLTDTVQIVTGLGQGHLVVFTAAAQGQIHADAAAGDAVVYMSFSRAPQNQALAQPAPFVSVGQYGVPKSWGSVATDCLFLRLTGALSVIPRGYQHRAWQRHQAPPIKAPQPTHRGATKRKQAQNIAKAYVQKVILDPSEGAALLLGLQTEAKK